MNHSNTGDSQADRSFLPDFCAIRTIFVVVVSAELLAMILAMASGKGIDQFWTELSLRSLYVQWVALGSAVVLCVFKQWLAQRSHTMAGVIAWLIVVAIAVTVSLLTRWLVPSILVAPEQYTGLLIKTVAISGIIGAVLLRYLFENFEQKQRELAEARSRYQALQARIRPHFLFNSMNTIASLTRIDPPLAESLIHDLSDLFRATMGKEGQLSTLAGEIDLGKRYMRIEQQRLGDRLSVNWEMVDIPADSPLPMLTLQPLLENAVYHGIEPSVNGGEVLISGQLQDGQIKINIQNTMESSSTDKRTDGANMAMDNVRQRLISIFGEQASLEGNPVEGGFLTVLQFPAKRPSA